MLWFIVTGEAVVLENFVRIDVFIKPHIPANKNSVVGEIYTTKKIGYRGRSFGRLASNTPFYHHINMVASKLYGF